MEMRLRRRTLGIQARLLILIVVTVLPLVTLASFTVLHTVDNERARIKRDLAGRVEDLLADVDRQIASVQAELKLLALSPILQRDDVTAFSRQIRATLQVAGISIVLYDAKGQQLISTDRPLDQLLPRPPDSEMLGRLFETGKPQISDLLMDPALQRPMLTVAVPVPHDGKPAYLLATALGPEVLAALLREQHLSPDWTVEILDRQGNIIARNRDQDRFLAQSAAPALGERVSQQAPEGWFPDVTSSGTAVYFAFRRSPTTGWTLAVSLPREAVDAPLRQARWLALGGGTAALLLSLALAGWMARAIERPVEALTAAAQALGRGEFPSPSIGGVRELDQVDDALRAAAVALERSRVQLEAMVEERSRELVATNERLHTEIGARELAQAAFVQAQKMEAVGQLTGGIAHDFNNLLTIVCGSLELLEARISDERSLALLHAAQRGALRGAKLTEYLLAFARKQRLEAEPADLNAIVTEMSEMLRRSIGVSIEIRHALAEELWTVLIDVNHIEVALLNIAINARDAMPGGGTLLIETRNVSSGSDTLPAEVAGQDCVLLSMRDSGTGMTAEVIDRAFEPFFTTKEIGKGTGLGLSMVFGVVRQSGGAVRICSRSGKGTTVQIYLPRSSEAAALRSRQTAPAMSVGGTHILVVDEDPVARWITAEHLRKMGHTVREADSGAAALTILDRGNPCDLIVVDLVMVNTVRLARRSRPNLKVIFSTAHADTSGSEEEIGGDVLLRKPFKPEALDAAVRAVLGKMPRRAAEDAVSLRASRQADAAKTADLAP